LVITKRNKMEEEEEEEEEEGGPHISQSYLCIYVPTYQ